MLPFIILYLKTSQQVLTSTTFPGKTLAESLLSACTPLSTGQLRCPIPVGLSRSKPSASKVSASFICVSRRQMMRVVILQPCYPLCRGRMASPTLVYELSRTDIDLSATPPRGGRPPVSQHSYGCSGHWGGAPAPERCRAQQDRCLETKPQEETDRRPKRPATFPRGSFKQRGGR